MTPFSTTTIDRDDPIPGETCQFHPGCCDPDGTSCDGCGTPATAAITFHRAGGEGPARRRFPYCAEHAELIAVAIIELVQEQRAAQN